MKQYKLTVHKHKHIALVAHDHKKHDLIEWVKFNKHILQNHSIYATGTTGKLVEEILEMSVIKFQSGPLGGDSQIGSHITDNKINVLIFFWDPLSAQPHDSDVKALLRLAMVWNIPTACNRSTADFLISSTLMDKQYNRLIQDYEDYKNRKI